jgi:hypothetical protein
MSRTPGRDIPRYIVHAQSHSQLTGRLFETGRQHQAFQDADEEPAEQEPDENVLAFPPPQASPPGNPIVSRNAPSSDAATA